MEVIKRNAQSIQEYKLENVNLEILIFTEKNTQKTNLDQLLKFNQNILKD